MRREYKILVIDPENWPVGEIHEHLGREYLVIDHEPENALGTYVIVEEIENESLSRV
jgi:hypothetical protein